MIRCLLGGYVCGVEDGHWSSPTPTLAKMLALLQTECEKTVLHGGIPNRDWASALYVTQQLDGTILDPMPETPPIPDGAEA